MNTKNNVGLKVLVIILIVLIVGLSGYIVYDKVISKDDVKQNGDSTYENNVQDVMYNYYDMEGFYKGKETVNFNGEKLEMTYTLYLLKNGTFKYEYSFYARKGFIGNYIIDNDKIKLNYMFETNSGAGLIVTHGSKELTINSNDVITIYDYEYKTDGIDSITLTRDNEVEVKDDMVNNMLELLKN